MIKSFVRSKIVRIGIVILVGIGVYNIYKPLPEGISYEGDVHTVRDADVSFLFDETYLDAQGARVSQQEIFDVLFTMIDDAQSYILIDMFLYNDFAGEGVEPYRDLTSEFTQKLIVKKQQRPDISIDVITDDINTMYGTRIPQHLQDLEDSGVQVIYTDLRPLRDSNPLYSAGWRFFAQWFGVGEGGFMPHPFSGTEEKVSVRSYLKLLNFKANHRKVVMADDGKGGFVSLVTSANPHNGSSAHSNVALQVRGDLSHDVYQAEKAVARMSGKDLASVPFDAREGGGDESDNIQIQFLTEGKIKKKILKEIEGTHKGESIEVSMFYFSDRDILTGLRDAAVRGVQIRIILDPNKDAFGHEKNGIPNRQVAHELLSGAAGENITVRWYATHGEQFHTKLLMIRKKNDTSILLLGSANYTRRNIADYNLEADVWLSTPTSSSVVQKAHAYFEKLWTNQNQRIYTTGYATYEDTSRWKSLLYKIQESTGLSTF